MRISHKYKFIYFANPKSGSSTVRILLNDYSDIEGIVFRDTTPERPFHAHMKPVDARIEFKRFGWNFEDYYRFTTVRNPWDRLVSLYEHIYSPNFRIKKKRSLKQIINYKIKYWSRPPFRKWLKTVDSKEYGAISQTNPLAMWRIYAGLSLENYIMDGDGNILVNDIIKLEELSESLPSILGKIGLPVSLALKIGQINKRTTGKPYRDYYDEECIEWVYNNYKYEIENFNYKF